MVVGVLEENGRADIGPGWGLFNEGERCLIREPSVRGSVAPRMQRDVIQAM